MPRPAVKRHEMTGKAKRFAARRCAIAAIVGLVLVLVGALLSLIIGSGHIGMGQSLHLLFHPDGSFESTVIHSQRIPRTILVILVGMALGVAGALMQSFTRNPLADPGVLGVNAGAAIAVVCAVAFFNIVSIWFYLWFAFLGAAMTSVAVYLLAGIRATPARLALAGVAISMAVTSLVQMVILSNQNAYNEFRFWAAGSVEGRGPSIIYAIVGFVLVGLVLAFLCAPGLNALALGEDSAKALGARIGIIRAAVMVAITLLAGSATAAVGPIMFIGLGVPYIARAITGPDQRYVLPLSALAAPVVLLAADLLARLVIAPQEIQTGVVTAILGGPVFIALIRSRKVNL
ncbi:MAG: iron ABC transporter permease [Corynebacterium sp.]|nr:iron ABC transporter permease [Corynebacterium sp.]